MSRDSESGIRKSEIRVEVVTIGDELLSGSIVDTNSSLIADKFLELGIEIRRMTSIGDGVREIQAALREITARAQLGILTGGLGPTGDDRTAEAAAEAFERPLRLHEPSLQRIRERFLALGLEMTSNNERQAYLPTGAEPIPNPMGTAPGFALEASGCLLIFLPGVPRELERMLDETVVPMVQRRFRPRLVVRSRVLKLFGITEAKIDQMALGALDELAGVTLASLPRYPENRLRITARADNGQAVEELIQEAEARLRSRVGNWVYGIDQQELESVVEALLRDGGKTLALAESCTGGLIAHRVTNVPGSSDVFKGGYVAYSLTAKEETLGVPRALLVTEGPVSAAVAEAMARGARQRGGTSLGLAVTGVAGPGGGTEETPVGTVFVGLANDSRCWSQRFRFRGGRTQVKTLAASVALDLLRRYLLGEDPTSYPAPWR